MRRMSALEFRSHGFKKGNKYNAKRTQIGDEWFDSKLEADRYVELMTLKNCGAIQLVLRQVPLRLPAGIVYRVDFMIVWTHRRESLVPPITLKGVLIEFDSTGRDFISWEDTKGVLTDVARIKIAQVESLYGIKVELIRRGKRA